MQQLNWLVLHMIMFGISPIRYSCLLMYFINVVSFSSFFVKSIFEMLTVRRQQLSFSTEKWISMGNIQYFEKQISFGWESTLLYHLSYKDDMFHNTCNIQSFINFWASLISYIKLPNSSYFQTIYACMYDLNTMKSSVDYKNILQSILYTIFLLKCLANAEFAPCVHL